jgi:hypothetical protein
MEMAEPISTNISFTFQVCITTTDFLHKMSYFINATGEKCLASYCLYRNKKAGKMS